MIKTVRIVSALSVCLSIMPAWAVDQAPDETLATRIAQLNNSVPAQVISLRDAQISAEIAANIQSIAVDVGDNVTKGELLAQLDCREFSASLEKAQADLATQEARLVGTQARVASQQSELEASQANTSLLNAQAKAALAKVKAAEVDFRSAKARSNADQAQCHLAGLELQRIKNLRQQQLVPQQELDQSQASFQAARATCSAVQTELEGSQVQIAVSQANAASAQAAVSAQQAKSRTAQNNLKAAQADIKAQQAQLEAAAARLKTERLMVSRCQLKAPFNGQIAARHVQLGQRIGIGEEAFQLVSVQQAEISATFSDAELASLQQAKRVFFVTPDGRIPVTLRAVVAIVSGEARTREARFSLADSHELAIGKSGRIIWEN